MIYVYVLRTCQDRGIADYLRSERVPFRLRSLKSYTSNEAFKKELDRFNIEVVDLPFVCSEDWYINSATQYKLESHIKNLL